MPPRTTPAALDRLNREVTSCRLCPRLVAYRERVAREKKREFRDWTYWGRPLPGFGDPRARLLLVGLAPAAHGGNRTGRMFTGDGSGAWLMRALHHAGFASKPDSISRDDGLVLRDAYVTAAVRCAPPANRPTPAEFATCFRYLEREYLLLPEVEGIVALGALAFAQTLHLLHSSGVTLPVPRPRFAHGAHYRLPGAPWLLATYHPSRQNTNTGRLTQAMLNRIFSRARQLLDRGAAGSAPRRTEDRPNSLGRSRG